MDYKDFIFEDSQDTKPEGEFTQGEKVVINNEEFEIDELVDIKNLEDTLGFPATYSWYKAKDQNGENINLFFFDGDIDNSEKNDKVAKKWFEDYKIEQ